MNYILKYVLLFVAVTVLQLFLFDALNLGTYVNPLVYIAFVVLLPMNIRPFALLMAGAVLGVSMDFLTGSAGLHTIATLAVAYTRPFVLNFIVGKEYVIEGGIPSVKSLGLGKFARYASIVIFLQCIVFFTFEAMNWQYFYFVALKIVLSGGVTLLFTWLITLIFTAKERSR
jgi:hypothetical protein